MTVSERIPFSGLLLPLQEGYMWEDETPIGTGLPMLFDFPDEVRILK